MDASPEPRTGTEIAKGRVIAITPHVRCLWRMTLTHVTTAFGAAGQRRARCPRRSRLGGGEAETMKVFQGRRPRRDRGFHDRGAGQRPAGSRSNARVFMSATASGRFSRCTRDARPLPGAAAFALHSGRRDCRAHRGGGGWCRGLYGRPAHRELAIPGGGLAEQAIVSAESSVAVS